jgi:hypothetical protein
LRQIKSTRDDSVRLSSLTVICGLPVAEKYATKILGEKDIESVLMRLDRLTFEESRATVAQILDVVYSLVNSMHVVMEGAHGQFV